MIDINIIFIKTLRQCRFALDTMVQGTVI